MSPDQWKAVIIFGNAAMALLVSAWAVKLALSEWPFVVQALGY